LTLELPISSETEAKIRKCAAELGQDIEAFVLQAVAEKLADTDVEPTVPLGPNSDWSGKLRACIDLHPVVTHFVDDGRESIYVSRGE
jgi:hypothetical protein